MQQTNESRRRICLFGLSADPPTGEGGHVGIAKALAELREDAAFVFDEVRVLPVYRHTFSEKRERLVSFEHRLRMCQEAFAGIPRVTVSDAEYQSWKTAVKGLSNEEQSKISVGTASLLDYYQRKEPDGDFSFCLGADAFLDLTAGKWKESSRVLEILHGRLVVLHRGDLTTDLERRMQSTPGARIIPMDHLEDVSSSQVRECDIVEDLKGMVVPEVLAYMQKHKLYQFDA